MKYIKLSGDLFLVGTGGITRVEALSEYDPNRKGKNKTLVHGVGFKAVVEETVDEIEEMISPALFKVTEVTIDSHDLYTEPCKSCEVNLVDSSSIGFYGDCIPF